MRKVLLVVTGSVSVYKSVILLREFQKRGADVRVVMTQAAQSFVTKLTYESLLETKVLSSWEDETGSIGHIEYASWADIVVVAPATANFLAKVANGIADDLPSATVLAAPCKVVVAPAMNVNMWNNASTVDNIETLVQRGVEVVYPEDGPLACGWNGAGRLAEPERICDVVLRTTPLEVVITAGGTREYSDPIRFISNKSSGKMGFALARSFIERGCSVKLICCNVTAPSELAFCTESVETTEDLRVALDSFLSSNGVNSRILLMAAAVCDYCFESISEVKQKKTESLELSLIKNTDVLRFVADRREEYVARSGVNLDLVGFAAETGDDQEVLSYAKGKLTSKGVNAIIANNASEVMDSDNSRFWYLAKEREEYFQDNLKLDNARALCSLLIEEFLSGGEFE